MPSPACCDLMLFEGGLYSSGHRPDKTLSCDLMLFEGGLYFAIKNGDFPFCCDLM